LLTVHLLIKRRIERLFVAGILPALKYALFVAWRTWHFRKVGSRFV